MRRTPAGGRRCLTKIKTFTDKPVTMVVNTHSHADHTGGNLELPSSVSIVAHQTATAQIAKLEAVVKAGGRGVPTRTFTDRLTLGAGVDRVELYYFGPGQTGGDAWVVFPPEARW